MKLAIDFDGSIVKQDGRDYNDVTSPLEFIPGARDALHSLKRAGHVLMLVSGRANLSIREDWRLNPLWAHGLERFSLKRWEAQKPVNEERFQQMIDFIGAELPGLFDMIDDGRQGKVSADMYIDDKGLRIGLDPIALDWGEVVQMLGEIE